MKKLLVAAFALVLLAPVSGCFLPGGDCDWHCHNRNHGHHYRAPGPEAAKTQPAPVKE